MDHSRKMLRFRDMLLFLNPPTQHEALLRARSAALATIDIGKGYIDGTSSLSMCIFTLMLNFI